MIIHLFLKGYFLKIVFNIFDPTSEKMVAYQTRLMTMGLQRDIFQRSLRTRIDKAGDCLYVEKEGE